MSYRVRSGDTMWGISQRYNVSLSTLAKLNPNIKNLALIFPGQVVRTSGQAPARPARPTRPASPTRPSRPTGPAEQPSRPSAGNPGRRALDIARSVLGQNAGHVKKSGPLAKYMPDWVPNNVNCANFVSGALWKAGLIRGNQASARVKDLAANLRRDPDWKQVSLKNAKPGDVVCLRTGRGDYSHVVMFAGWKNGRAVFIGSNNVNADGSQRITYSTSRYPINAIFQPR